MAIPDYQILMLPVLTIAGEGEQRVPTAAQVIADRLGLSEEDREEMLPSGKQRVPHNRVHWAKFYMSKAGLIDNPKRGVFIVSAAGKALLATQPKRIDTEMLKTLPTFAEFNGNSGVSSESDQAVVAATASDARPEEQIDAAHAVLTAALKADFFLTCPTTSSRQ
jgi:restriction system protein